MRNSTDLASGLIESDYLLSQSQLNQLLKLVRAVNGITSTSKLIQKMSSALVEIIPCLKALVWLFDADKQTLRTISGKNRIVVPINKSLAGRMVTSGEPLYLQKPQNDPLFNKNTDSIPGQVTGHLICHPVKNDGKIIAVIQLMNTEIYPFTPAAVNLITEWCLVCSGHFLAAINYEESKLAFDSFVDTISHVLDTRDYISSGHSRRVTLYALEVASVMGLPAAEKEILRYAGLLHDIGKIGVPELILLKNKRPTDDEYEIIKRHAGITHSILTRILFPQNLKQVVSSASTHHERIDGKGYPEGLDGEKIPPGGKILAVCDVFDALSSRRPYEDRKPVKEVIDLLQKEIGSAFEPYIVYNFRRISLDRLIQILEYGHSDGFEEDDLEFLKAYTLNDLVSTNKILTDEQQRLENIFMRYYNRQYRG